MHAWRFLLAEAFCEVGRRFCSVLHGAWRFLQKRFCSALHGAWRFLFEIDGGGACAYNTNAQK